MKALRYSAIVVFALLLPQVALAQTFRKFTDVSAMVVGLLNKLFPVLIALALLAFFWGMIKYIAKSGSDDGRKQGREVMVWGVTALFVMVSLWGIIAFMQVALFDRVLSPARVTPQTIFNNSFGGTNNNTQIQTP